MSIKYFVTTDGYFANLFGVHGCLEATVHRPDKRNGLKAWRLCFASCTGQAKGLQGKVREHHGFAAVKDDLRQCDALLNAAAQPADLDIDTFKMKGSV